MGYGRSFVCSKCKKEYRASWGVGFSFPEEYEKTLSDIRKGKYGDEMKAISHDEKHIAVSIYHRDPFAYTVRYPRSGDSEF